MFHRPDACLADSRVDENERACETNAREHAAAASRARFQASENVRHALERCVRAHDEDTAAFLARRLLRAHQPCPVCGSCEHPSPARAGADTDGADFELAEALARRDAAVADEKRALRRLAEAEAALAVAQARHQAVKRQKRAAVNVEPAAAPEH